MAERHNPERSQFYSDLFSVNRMQRASIRQLPKVNGTQIDLFLLFNEISSRGGYKKVVLHNKWPEIADAIGLIGNSLGIDNYLRQIYNRYLFPLEDRRDPKYDSPIRKDVDLFFSLPSSYNYNFLYLDNIQRNLNGLPELSHVINPSFHLELSLLSGVPSSVDFALNCCLLMTHDVPLPRVDLNKCRQLLDIILGWLAFNRDRSYDPIFSQHWNSYSFASFPHFWESTTLHFDSIRCLVVDGNWSPSVHAVSKPQRIFATNILTIVHNAIFDDWNVLLVSRHENVLRLLLLAAFNTSGEMRATALSALEIASHRVVVGDGCLSSGFRLLISEYINFNQSPLPELIKGLQIATGLCNSLQNRNFMENIFTSEFLESIFEGFIVLRTNVSVLLNALEFFRALFSLSSNITILFSEMDRSFDCFLELLLADSRWLSACDFSNLTFGQQQVRFVNSDPPQRIPIPQETGLLDAHSVVQLRRWLISTINPGDSVRISISRMFRSYLEFCESSNILSLPKHIFSAFVWSVFPSLHLNKDDGICFVEESGRNTFRVDSPELMDSFLAEKIKNNQFTIKRVLNIPQNGPSPPNSKQLSPSSSPKRQKFENSSHNSPVASPSCDEESVFSLSEIFDSKDPDENPFPCWWDKCRSRFKDSTSLESHLIQDHINVLSEGCCPWIDCSLTYHRKWSLICHILDTHSPKSLTLHPPTDPVSHSDPTIEFSFQSEDDLVKHIRLQSAYIVRSWCFSSPQTLRIVKRFEPILSDMMLSGCDCRKVLADCLYCLQLDDD